MSKEETQEEFTITYVTVESKPLYGCFFCNYVGYQMVTCEHSQIKDTE